MAVADLLWIDCNEPQAPRSFEVAAAARQHVMLNYIAKQQPRRSGSKHSSSSSEDDDEADTDSFMPKFLALKGKGSRRKRGPSHRAKSPLASTINPSLVLAEDSEIYQAAWWHSLNICENGQRQGWIDVCRTQWGQGFWEFAREDGTLREIFLSYAAAKEASVKSLSDSRAYFFHKGKAMRLVAQDLKREGRELRIAAVAAICLLAKATFIEEEYEAGHAHVSAIKAVVEDRLFELPSFLWLFVIWADLRLTGVSSRAPALPYGVHPDLAEAKLPVDMRERAKFLGACNLFSLPAAAVLENDKISLLFQRLHELTFVYNSPYDTDWPPVWVVTYDGAWLLANLRHEVRSFEEAQEEDDTPYNPEKILLLASNIQLWSTCSQFVPQAGFLRYALDQLTLSLAHVDPDALSDHWLSCSGKLDSLLWLLFNASAAAIKLCFTGHISTVSMPHWLWLDLQHVVNMLSIGNSAAFEKALRPFPFADNWNGRMSKTVWLWLKTGFVLPDGQEKRRRRAFFANLRLTFDVEVDERMMKNAKDVLTAGQAYEMVLRGKDGDVGECEDVEGSDKFSYSSASTSA